MEGHVESSGVKLGFLENKRLMLPINVVNRKLAV